MWKVEASGIAVGRSKRPPQNARREEATLSVPKTYLCTGGRKDRELSSRVMREGLPSILSDIVINKCRPQLPEKGEIQGDSVILVRQ